MTIETHITQSVIEIFEALTRGQYDNFALFSCFVDGEPATAIVTVNRKGKDYIITPLFVTPTTTMTLTDHDGWLANIERDDRSEKCLT